MSVKPESMIITVEECTTLAELAGVQRFFGFLPGRQEPTAEEVCEDIFAMVQDDLLEITDEGPKLNGFLEEVFRIVRMSRKVLVIYPGSQHSTCACVYLSDAAACMEVSGKGIGDLRVCLPDAGEVLEWLLERLELPDTRTPLEFLKELNESSEGELAFQDARELCEQEHVMWILDVLDARDGSIRQRLLLLEEELFPVLVVQTQGHQETAYYSKEQFRRWLAPLLSRETDAQ